MAVATRAPGGKGDRLPGAKIAHRYVRTVGDETSSRRRRGPGKAWRRRRSSRRSHHANLRNQLEHANACPDSLSPVVDERRPV